MLVERKIELKNEPNTYKFCALSTIQTTQQLSQINTLVTWKEKSRDQRSGPYQKNLTVFG